MLDWENLRYVLAIGRAKTLLSAAEQMGVNQTTVGRRLQIVEDALGARLFDRVEQRLVPTVAGMAAIRRAERMEAEAQKAALEVAGRDKSLVGPVRLTSLAVVTNYFLVPQMPELYDKYPGIELDLIDTQSNLDLASREADIAIRLARPNIASAVASRIGNLSFRVYVAKRFLSQADDLPWIGYSESKAHLPEAVWLSRNIGKGRTLMRTDDAALRAGLVVNLPCRALLPDARVSKEMGLVALGGPKPVLQRELWLIYMKELRSNARVAAVAQWAKKACRARLS